MRKRQVDLDDLVTLGGYANEVGVSRQAAINWRTRWPDFPEPLFSLDNGDRRRIKVYTRRDLDLWREATGRSTPSPVIVKVERRDGGHRTTYHFADCTHMPRAKNLQLVPEGTPDMVTCHWCLERAS